MPNLGFAEILVLAVLALVIFGPNRLPEIGRSVGKGIREFRRASSEIRAELEFDEEPPVVPSPAERRRAAERERNGSDPDGSAPPAS